MNNKDIYPFRLIIFDFDLTLVNTQPVEVLREARNWREVISKAPDLKVFPGTNGLLRKLHAQGETLAIVTMTPDMVPRALLKQHKWPIDIVVGYHQVKRHKPDPECLILAMKEVGATRQDTFHIGDRPEDTEASRAANVTAIGAGWGLTDIQPLKASEPDHLFMSVSELENFLLKEL